MADWQRDDRELLARILAAEAGNQGPVGMTAAGNVIMNRANLPGYGDGVRGVIMKPGQFSPMNSVTGYAGGEQGQNIDAISPSETAYMVADSLLSGEAGDITGGATHFYNPEISNPSWAQGVEFTRIGDHVFGRADAPRGQSSAANTTQRSQPMAQPMQQQQQPRGILEMFGVQKMNPEAQGETALPFYQRPTFSNLMGDLALGFNQMRLRPDEGLAQRIGGRRQQREQQAQTNRTLEYLQQQPGSEAAVELIRSGASPTQALQFYYKSLQPAEVDQTAGMQNYQFLLAKGMDPQTAMERAFGGGPNIQVGSGIERVGDYILVPDPNSETGVKMELIPNSETDRAQTAAAEAEVARLGTAETQEENKESVVSGGIDNLVSMIDQGGIFNLPEAGIVGNVLGSLGVNQQAVDFRNELATIQANIAFDRLQQMRNASKTGGALGAVSERELDLLMNAYGNLNQSTSPDLLRRNLLSIKRIMTKIENDPVASAAYYGGAGGGGGSPTNEFSVTGRID